MKTLIFLIFFFVVMSSGFAFPNSITPLGMNFNGLVTAGHNIIAYSDVGDYFMTTDRGKSWHQYSTGVSDNIKVILNDNDTLWGVASRGKVLKSTDYGVHWNIYNCGLEEGDSLFFMAVNSQFIYLRTKSAILRYNKEFNFIISYQDSLLFCDKKEYNYGYNYYGSDAFKYMGFSDGALVVSVSQIPYNKNGQLLILSDSLTKIKTVKLSDYINDGSYLGFELTYIYHDYKGKDLFIINYAPYFVDSNFTQWSILTKDYKRMQGEYDDFNRNLVFSFFVYKNDLYCGGAMNFEVYSSLPMTEDDNPHFNYWNLGIKKYDSEKDSLEYIGSLFHSSDYYAIGAPNYSDGISQSFWDKKFIIFEDSIIVWAGQNKGIFQSTDSGNNWKLISFFKTNNEFNNTGSFYSFIDNKPLTIINDSIFYFLYVGKNEIFRTYNGGENFFPVEIDSINHIPSFQHFYFATICYIDSTGNGIFTGNNYNEWYSPHKLAITQDSGKSFNFITLDTNNMDFSHEYFNNGLTISNLALVNNSILFAMNYGLFHDLIKIFSINLITNETIQYYSDSLNFIHFILADNLQHYYSFISKQLSYDTNNVVFRINKTNDSGKTWQIINSINQKLNITQVYELNKDTVLICSANPARIYLFERIFNKIDTIFSDNSRSYSNIEIMNINDKLFIVGDSLFLENTERNDMTKWQTGKWDYGTPTFYNVLCKRNIALAELSDSLRIRNTYKITMNNKTTGIVKNEIKIIPRDHFYITPPVPIPANDFVSSTVYWDYSNFNPTNATKYICDMFGQKIRNADEIMINDIQENNAKITWDCSKVASGIYFLILNYSGDLIIIPIVVTR